MRFRKLMVFLVAFWMIGALVPTKASAEGFRLRVEDMNGHGVVITDEMIGDIAGPSGSGAQPGIIMFSLTGLGGTSTSLTVAQGREHPYDGTALGDLYLNSLTITSDGPAQLKLTLEDTGYTQGTGWLKLTSHMIDTLPGFFDAAEGSTATIRSYITNSADAPDLGPDSLNPNVAGNLGAMGSITGAGTDAQILTAPSNALAPDSSTSFFASGPYSLYTQVLVNLTGAGTLSFYQDASVVQGVAPLEGPEPMSLLLISTGVLGAAGARRRFNLGRA